MFRRFFIRAFILVCAFADAVVVLDVSYVDGPIGKAGKDVSYVYRVIAYDISERKFLGMSYHNTPDEDVLRCVQTKVKDEGVDRSYPIGIGGMTLGKFLYRVTVRDLLNLNKLQLRKEKEEDRLPLILSFDAMIFKNASLLINSGVTYHYIQGNNGHNANHVSFFKNHEIIEHGSRKFVLSKSFKMENGDPVNMEKAKCIFPVISSNGQSIFVKSSPFVGFFEAENANAKSEKGAIGELVVDLEMYAGGYKKLDGKFHGDADHGIDGVFVDSECFVVLTESKFHEKGFSNAAFKEILNPRAVFRYLEKNRLNLNPLTYVPIKNAFEQGQLVIKGYSYDGGYMKVAYQCSVNIDVKPEEALPEAFILQILHEFSALQAPGTPSDVILQQMSQVFGIDKAVLQSPILNFGKIRDSQSKITTLINQNQELRMKFFVFSAKLHVPRTDGSTSVSCEELFPSQELAKAVAKEAKEKNSQMPKPSASLTSAMQRLSVSADPKFQEAMQYILSDSNRRSAAINMLQNQASAAVPTTNATYGSSFLARPESANSRPI